MVSNFGIIPSSKGFDSISFTTEMMEGVLLVFLASDSGLALISLFFSSTAMKKPPVSCW